MDHLQTQHVLEWGYPEVLNWLQANGLSAYIGFFERHRVTGRDLLSLNENHFKEIGLSGYHQDLLMMKIDQLRSVLADVEKINDMDKNAMLLQHNAMLHNHQQQVHAMNTANQQMSHGIMNVNDMLMMNLSPNIGQQDNLATLRAAEHETNKRRYIHLMQARADQKWGKNNFVARWESGPPAYNYPKNRNKAQKKRSGSSTNRAAKKAKASHTSMIKSPQHLFQEASSSPQIMQGNLFPSSQHSSLTHPTSTSMQLSNQNPSFVPSLQSTGHSQLQSPTKAWPTSSSLEPELQDGISPLLDLSYLDKKSSPSVDSTAKTIITPSVTPTDQPSNSSSNALDSLSPLAVSASTAPSVASSASQSPSTHTLSLSSSSNTSSQIQFPQNLQSDDIKRTYKQEPQAPQLSSISSLSVDSILQVQYNSNPEMMQQLTPNQMNSMLYDNNTTDNSHTDDHNPNNTSNNTNNNTHHTNNNTANYAFARQQSFLIDDELYNDDDWWTPMNDKQLGDLPPTLRRIFNSCGFPVQRQGEMGWGNSLVMVILDATNPLVGEVPFRNLATRDRLIFARTYRTGVLAKQILTMKQWWKELIAPTRRPEHTWDWFVATLQDVKCELGRDHISWICRVHHLNVAIITAVKDHDERVNLKVSANVVPFRADWTWLVILHQEDGYTAGRSEWIVLCTSPHHHDGVFVTDHPLIRLIRRLPPQLVSGMLRQDQQQPGQSTVSNVPGQQPNAPNHVDTKNKNEKRSSSSSTSKKVFRNERTVLLSKICAVEEGRVVFKCLVCGTNRITWRSILNHIKSDTHSNANKTDKEYDGDLAALAAVDVKELFKWNANRLKSIIRFHRRQPAFGQLNLSRNGTKKQLLNEVRDILEFYRMVLQPLGIKPSQFSTSDYFLLRGDIAAALRSRCTAFAVHGMTDQQNTVNTQFNNSGALAQQGRIGHSSGGSFNPIAPDGAVPFQPTDPPQQFSGFPLSPQQESEMIAKLAAEADLIAKLRAQLNTQAALQAAEQARLDEQARQLAGLRYGNTNLRLPTTGLNTTPSPNIKPTSAPAPASLTNGLSPSLNPAWTPSPQPSGASSGVTTNSPVPESINASKFVSQDHTLFSPVTAVNSTPLPSMCHAAPPPSSPELSMLSSSTVASVTSTVASVPNAVGSDSKSV